MKTPTPPRPATDAFLPARITVASTTFAAVYGVPIDTVALSMLNILGGLCSASTRLRFAGTLHPLGMHVALVDAGAKESEPLEAELIAPLLEEVQRLKDLKAKNLIARKQFEEQVAHLKLLQPRSTEATACMANIRQLASILGPDLLQVGPFASGKDDGLSAPVLMPMLNDMIASRNEGGLRNLIQTFGGEPGRTATILCNVSFDAARWLTDHPLIQTAAGWPLMILPKHGSPFLEVDDGALDEAREHWRELVNCALRYRYGEIRALVMSPSAMLVVDEIKQEVERRAFLPGNRVASLWMMSAAIRLGATVHLLEHAESVTLQGDSLKAVVPLILRAADTQKALFPGRRVLQSKRLIPIRATTKTECEKVRVLILRYPNASDRQIRRRLPTRPAGYWTFLIRSVRENCAPNSAANFTATAATTAAASLS